MGGEVAEGAKAADGVGQRGGGCHAGEEDPRRRWRGLVAKGGGVVRARGRGRGAGGDVAEGVVAADRAREEWVSEVEGAVSGEEVRAATVVML